MRLTILGSSTPYPRPDNPCSGYLVQHGETSIWMDAGTGTLGELQRHIALEDLDAIWISHGHADHAADLLTAYYALRFADLRPSAPVQLIGPPGLVDRLVGFLGHRSAAVIPEVFALTVMDGWGSAVIGDLALSWGPVNHGMPAYGLRIECGSGVLAYSGDSAYCEGLVELAEGADLFVCEAGTSANEPGEQAVHCTPEDAANIAVKAGAQRLLLTHIDSEIDWFDAAARALAIIDFVDLPNPGEIHEIGETLT